MLLLFGFCFVFTVKACPCGESKAKFIKTTSLPTMYSAYNPAGIFDCTIGIFWAIMESSSAKIKSQNTWKCEKGKFCFQAYCFSNTKMKFN
jgi:hypothetical protein